MLATPPPRGVRRLIGPSHANRRARLVMITGGAIQAVAVLAAASAIHEGRLSGALTSRMVQIAILVYVPAAYLNALGYTHLNAARAIVYLPVAAVLGVLSIGLLVLSGGGLGGDFITRVEGEPEAPPLHTNFAAQLITSSDAGQVLGTPANPPTGSSGFGNSVSSCTLHATTGRGQVDLRVIQGGGTPRLFERYAARGQHVSGLGDAAAMSKRDLVVIVADTMVHLTVIGVRVDDLRRQAMFEVAGRVVDRLRQPGP